LKILKEVGVDYFTKVRKQAENDLAKMKYDPTVKIKETRFDDYLL